MAAAPGTPEWVVDMTDAVFKTGKGSNSAEKGYFCVICGGESISQDGIDKEHVGHKVVQVMSCSQSYGYKIDDIVDIMDLYDFSGVCPYKINTTYVLFPRSRKKINRKNSDINSCVVCKAVLSTSAEFPCDQFCSIKCKLDCQDQRHRDFPSNVWRANVIARNSKARKSNNQREEKIVRKRSRKGVPCRAPLL